MVHRSGGGGTEYQHNSGRCSPFVVNDGRVLGDEVLGSLTTDEQEWAGALFRRLDLLQGREGRVHEGCAALRIHNDHDILNCFPEPI